MLIHWIWLSQRKQIPVSDKLRCLAYFQDPEYIYEADEKVYAQMEDLSAKTVASLMDKDLTAAREILQRCGEKNISILTYNDSAYPPRLKNIAVPPLVLYYKGSLPLWQEMPPIGIVGTRRASAGGMKNARRFGYEIAFCGGIVISGGAEGIDGAALEGAMEAGKNVVAVLGFGADVVYPAKHKNLFAAIERQGCLLTEYPPGTRPAAWNFPMRNRLISGISAAVLVVEAPERSGAMNTARHAQDQGRELYVVPGAVDDPLSAGSNSLLKDRAMAVTCGWDVVEAYASLYPYTTSRFAGTYQPRNSPSPEAYPKVSRAKNDKNAIDNQKKCQYSVNAYSDLTDEERQIVEKLTEDPIAVDGLLLQLDIPAGRVMTLLTTLSLKGVVQNHPGNFISLK